MTQRGARFARVLAKFSCALLLPVLSIGCQSRLPGPIDCEDMAGIGMGRSLAEISGSPQARSILNRVVHTCLTAPFDFETIECVESGQGLYLCSERLAERHPSRQKALERLLEDLQKLKRLRPALKRAP